MMIKNLALKIDDVEEDKAYLTGSDFTSIEIPLRHLPKELRSQTAGRFKITIERDTVSEDAIKDKMKRFAEWLKAGPAQADIELKKRISDDPGFLYISHRSHFSATIRWTAFSSLPFAQYVKLHATDPWCNGIKLSGNGIAKIKVDEEELRLFGLSAGESYEVCLVFRTSTGMFKTQKVTVQTPTLQDFSGLMITVDTEWPQVERERIYEIIRDLGADYTEAVEEGRTTQLVSDLLESECSKKAKELNIPIVTYQWLEACRMEKKVASVSEFYSVKKQEL